MKKLTINFIGPGKVGLTVMRRIAISGAAEIQDVAGRSAEGVDRAIAFVGTGTAAASIADMRPADLWFLTVPDSLIASVSSQLAAAASASGRPSVAVHCSGFMVAGEMRPLADIGWRLASLHPVLTFAEQGKAVDRFEGIFCGVEGDPEAVALVEALVRTIGGKPFRIRTEAKAIYHAAAVFSSNFNVVLQALAREAWAQAGVPDDIAAEIDAALMSATTENVKALGPASALTGPAARGDLRVVREQESAVRAWHPAAGDLYRDMSALARRLKLSGTTRGQDGE